MNRLNSGPPMQLILSFTASRRSRDSMRCRFASSLCLVSSFAARRCWLASFSSARFRSFSTFARAFSFRQPLTGDGNLVAVLCELGPWLLLLGLPPYPRGLLGAAIVADALDRAVLEEPVLLDPSAIRLRRDDVGLHLYGAVFGLKGCPALGRGGAHSVEDLRGARLAMIEVCLAQEHLLEDQLVVEGPRATVFEIHDDLALECLPLEPPQLIPQTHHALRSRCISTITRSASTSRVISSCSRTFNSTPTALMKELAHRDRVGTLDPAIEHAVDEVLQLRLDVVYLDLWASSTAPLTAFTGV